MYQDTEWSNDSKDLFLHHYQISQNALIENDGDVGAAILQVIGSSVSNNT